MSNLRGAASGRGAVEAKALPRRRCYKSRLEERYANYLDLLIRAGEIQTWAYEGLGFRLANRCFYYPDFLVIMPSGAIQLHETKGYCRDDARAKFRIAAERWPWFRWAIVTEQKGHGFKLEFYD